MSCFVLVHGSFGGGWMWSRVAKLLREKGHEVHTPTLTGLAERSHLLSPDVDLSTHILDISNLLEYEQLLDVVLVGHSYGGMVTTGVLGRQPDRVSHMVYVDAYAPEAGQGCFDILPWLQEPVLEMAKLHDGHYLDPLDPAGLGVTDPDEAGWINERSTLMPLAAIVEPLPSGGSAEAEPPITFVNCTKMGLFQQTAEAGRRRGWKVHDLDTHHYPQVSEPVALAELMGQAVL